MPGNIGNLYFTNDSSKKRKFNDDTAVNSDEVKKVMSDTKIESENLKTVRDSVKYFQDIINVNDNTLN